VANPALQLLPDLSWERAWWDASMELVAGVDEVGRGALAGPLIAAAVILPAGLATTTCGLSGLLESKLLTAARRDDWFDVVIAESLAVGIGLVDVDELDAVGVGPANRIAMERAVYALPAQPAALLLDAMVIESDLPQVGIIDGDARCLSIAAASIVAKVTRDRLMCRLHEQDGRYGFARHKGYGTAVHLAALQQYGPCASHRRSFAPVAACCLEA
jgi:ribonuclease HII